MINTKKENAKMKEAKVAGGRSVRAKKRRAWCVATRFADGIVTQGGILFDSEEGARRCALGMRDHCLNEGNLKGAEMYDASQFAVYPVEVEEPEIAWEAAK